MEKFFYKIKKDENVMVVNLNGYIDTTTVGIFKKMFEKIRKMDLEKIYLDFNNVDYVSSSGWGTLVSNVAKLKDKKVNVYVGGMNKGVKNIFDLMDLSRLIVYSDDIPSSGKEVLPDDERKTVYVDERSRALIKNLVVENPFAEEKELRRSFEQKAKTEIDEEDFRTILSEMELETREKRLAFAYKTLRKFIKSKK